MMYALEFACPRRHTFRKHYEDLKQARELRKSGSHFLCPHCNSSVHADPAQVIYGDNGQDLSNEPIWYPAPGPIAHDHGIMVAGRRLHDGPIDLLKLQQQINANTNRDIVPTAPPDPAPLLTYSSHILDHAAEALVKHAEWAIEQAQHERSNTSLVGIGGMSSTKVRCLLNNLNSLPGARYLEIGIHQGSTFIPAVNNNPHVVAVAIDNWCTHGSGESRGAFFKNLNQYNLLQHTVIDNDCFNLKPEERAKIGGINIYFYDGEHRHEDQSKALTYYIGAMTDTFIYICDDWNHEPSKTGTREAEEKLGLKVCKKWELGTGYWNGILVAVYQKPSK